MAKPNAHTASRDELRGAGVRAELVDEILKQRRRKYGPTLEALGEVPGVGPATLEQLRQALDFTPPGQGGEAKSEPPPPPSQRERPAGDGAKAEAKAEDGPRPARPARPADDGRDDDRGDRGDQAIPKAPEPAVQAAEGATDAAEATLRAGTEQAADVLAATARGGAEAARHAVEAGAQAADLATRAGLRVLERTTGAAAEAVEGAQLQAAQGAAQATPDAAAFGRTFLELLQEQGQENLAAMAALGRTRDLGEVLKIQGDYLRGTLERMTELNRRWLALAGTAWPGGLPLGEGRGDDGRD